MNTINKVFRGAIRCALPALILAASQGTLAQTAKPVAAASAMTSSVGESDFMRASALIGKNVHDADNKNMGEIRDMIIDVTTGTVRYVMFEYDPGVFKTGKLYAVPMKSLTLAADGKTLGYNGVTREQLDRVATNKTDWKAALANTRYLDSVDTVYGVKRENVEPNLQRASDLIGRDVNSREGKDIGDIKELVVDMRTSTVRYAVLAFDPSIFSAEKMFAFPMTAFKPGRDRDHLTLDVDRQRLEAMKSFDKDRWSLATDIRSIDVNKLP